MNSNKPKKQANLLFRVPRRIRSGAMFLWQKSRTSLSYGREQLKSVWSRKSRN